VRIIEYEILYWTDLEQMGDLAELLRTDLEPGSEVGILRCVANPDRKVTFVGRAAATRELVASVGAGSPKGIALLKKDFPVMLEGWPYRFRTG
jgi:hypothetical protein